MRINLGQLVLLAALRLYRWAVSPVLHFLCGPPAGCRFTPTCSEYAMEAVQRHGAVSGSWLGVRRLCRCHPWGGCGHDPVPVRLTGDSPEAASPASTTQPVHG